MSTADMIAQAKAAGFSGFTLLEAVAISLAEDPSSDPNMVNHNPNGTTDRGYWQINSIHGAQSTFDPAGNAKAAYALSAGGRNWGAWSTLAHDRAGNRVAIADGPAVAAVPAAAKALGLNPASGAYKDYVGLAFHSQAQETATEANKVDTSVLGTLTAAAKDPVGALTGGIGSTLDAAKQALGFVAAADVWIANPHNWLRVVEVIGGLAGLLIGLDMLASTGVGGPVGTVARAGAHVTRGAGKAAALAAL